jgi:hypothetical protein
MLEGRETRFDRRAALQLAMKLIGYAAELE